MNKEVFLSCTIDVLTGSIVYTLEAMIKDKKSIISSWSGNCTMEIPLTATNHLDNVRNIVNIVSTGITSGVATSNPLDYRMISIVSNNTKKRVKVVVATPSQIKMQQDVHFVAIRKC